MRNKLLVVLATCVICRISSAAPVTFTYTGNNSGSLNGVPFSSRTFVITGYGDTDNRELVRIGLNNPFGWFIDHTAAKIAIEGFPELQFESATRTFVNMDNGVVGFSRGTVEGLDLYTGWLDPMFYGWDMTTSIGPVNGLGTLRQWDFAPPVQTTGGTLVVDVKFSTPGTFLATVVPEPSTLCLFAISFVTGLAATRRNRSVKL